MVKLQSSRACGKPEKVFYAMDVYNRQYQDQYGFILQKWLIIISLNQKITDALKNRKFTI